MLTMDRHRRVPGVIGLWAAAWLASASTGLAQGAAATARPQAPALLGLVRRADGSPLAGAEVRAFARPPGADVPGLAGVLTAPEPCRAIADAGGAFRLEVATPARLELRHPDGLGAALELVEPGNPVRVVATPLGEVELPPNADGAFVHGADSVPLGFHPGPRVRLAAGAYRLLVRYAEGFDEHAVTVADSARIVLFRRADGSRSVMVAGPTACGLVVDDWTEVVLRPDANGRVRLWQPARPATAQVLTWRIPGPDGAVALHRTVTTDGADPVTLPAVRWQPLRVAVPPVGAVASVVGSPAAARCVALSPVVTVDAHSTAFVPEGFGDGAALVLLAPEAPVVDLAGEPDADLLARPVQLAVRVADARGPVASATVELSGPPPCVPRHVRTDARGQATVHALPRHPGTLRFWSPEHLPLVQPLTVEQLDRGELVLQVERGAHLAGRVLLDGQPLGRAMHVDLTLRDTTGILATPNRRADVGDDGAFRFGGLDPNGRYTLFATAQVAGVTHSAKVHGVLPGTDVVVDLRTEDVAAPGQVRR